MKNTFFMPAEWESHEGSWVSWPVKDSLVFPENHEEVCKSYANVINAILSFEKCMVLANPKDKGVIEKLCHLGVEVLEVEHSDAWIRDNGPTILTDLKGNRCGVNWKFNAWGEKYLPFDLDDDVAKQLLIEKGIPRIDASLVLEGGSIHCDGEGTILTTEQCLLHPNRNPQLSRYQIEERLKEYTGTRKIIWLKHGLSGDETDGHVDNIACFARPGVVLMQTCNNKEDLNHEITKENLSILAHETDACGRKFEIIEIEQPPIRYYKGERLTLSYLNFYFVNGGIILPIFGGDAIKTDEKAKAVLKQVFPDRVIRCVNGMGLIKEGGNVHCITQQLPQPSGEEDIA